MHKTMYKKSPQLIPFVYSARAEPDYLTTRIGSVCIREVGGRWVAKLGPWVAQLVGRWVAQLVGIWVAQLVGRWVAKMVRELGG
jgi:hypothetical protein